MATDFIKLKEDIDCLLDSLADRIPPVPLEDMREFNMVGEWTEATENLCATLVKREIAVSSEHRDALAAVLKTLGPQDDVYYSYINRKASTLAALNVQPG